MYKLSHLNGKNLIRELELMLNDIHRYSDMVNQHVITSSTDLDGKITSVSQAFCRISGYSEDELIGQNHNLFRHPDMPDSFFKEMWETIQADKPWTGEVKNSNKNGEAYWVTMNIDPIKDASGKTTGYLAIRHDITDHKRIESLTITDDLTGAWNRRQYNRILPLEISRARRDNSYLCFLMMDADNFKKYNDTYGHQAGDEVLKTIVSTTKSCFQRSSDSVFRLGGEEFAVLYSVDDPEQAILVAERCKTMLYDQNIEHSGNPPYQRVTLSMGLMILHPDKSYIKEEIYKYADEALYTAKRNGRNTLVVHDTENDIELF